MSDLVGLTIIQDLVDYPGVGLAFSGLVFGLALAVLNELSASLSALLVLRLMRRLVPVVLLVLVIFLIALPFRFCLAAFHRRQPC